MDNIINLFVGPMCKTAVLQIKMPGDVTGK